mmetsp:Transcript_9028/g.11648  ORF Transcript_9028/g.11648 Transcript_9028/m.11648 type:complete len:247 (+) Transcript_9028:64-804(+)
MKLSVATVASLITTATAFAPSAQVSTVTNSRLYSQDDSEDAGLWGTPTPKDGETQGDMSVALPFAPRPKLLDGKLPGDAGFDPLGFAGQDMQSLKYMREAEIKHGRLAMLATVGWPLAELYDKSLAEAFNLPVLLTKTGESPSVLNGGLEKISPAYWVLVIAIAGIFEIDSATTQEEKGKDYILGDCGFDPLSFFPESKQEQFEMQTKEIKHGRVAMMAILGFAVQEALYNTPVTTETPFFFQPIF